MALGDANPQKFHRKHGKLYYNIKSLDFDEDLIVDENGVPDVTQNPDAVFIGATDAGYDFTAEPPIVEETYDEIDALFDVSVDGWNAQIERSIDLVVGFFNNRGLSSKVVTSICGADKYRVGILRDIRHAILINDQVFIEIQ